MSTKKNNKGFVLIYAVILTSVLLVISIFMSDIITRQIIISSIGKNYQSAYYIANIGRECAVFQKDMGRFGYVDKMGSSFSYTPPSGVLDEQEITDEHPMSCGQSSELTVIVDNTNPFDYSKSSGMTGSFTVTNSANECAIVSVFVGVAEDGSSLTSIESKGYNMACDSTSERKVEAITELKSVVETNQ
jgi:hypothetical protein